jgi:hypothetical protein
MGALLDPDSSGLVTSEHADSRPCVVCGAPTTHRVGRRKSPTAWAWRSPRCADTHACTVRSEAKKRDRRQGHGHVHIVLVGCAAHKRCTAGTAADLYMSQLFRSARAWAERHGDAWYILSARHGLLAPETLVEPYEQHIASLDRAQRRGWARQVADRLQQLHPGIFGCQVTVLAGRLYVEPLQDIFGELLELPLAGRAIGQRLAWFKRELER